MRARLRRTVERHPLLWVALMASAGVLLADRHHPVAGGVALLVVLAVLFLSGRRQILGLGLFCALLAGGLHAWRKAPQDADLARITKEKVRSAEIVAEIISDPRQAGEDGWSALATVYQEGRPGKVWVQGSGELPRRWEKLLIKGRFEPLPAARNPGIFNMADWLYRQGAWANFDSREPGRGLAPPSGFHLIEDRARAKFRHAVTAGLAPESREAAVIRAMVLGDTPASDQELLQAYRNSGTLHVFSVSGMHVAMVGLIGWFVLKLLGVPRRVAVVLLLAGMLAYAWVTGMKPPAVRSVVMAAALLGAFLVRRRPDLLNALGFALLAAVLTDGHLLFQAGVQLSFGVVYVIGIGTAFAAYLFKWIEAREMYLPRSLYGWGRAAWLWFREKVTAALAASTAASVGSIPLTLWHFGFLAPISILASPIIGLPVLALMALALSAVVVSPFPRAAEAVNRANGYVANSCTATAEFFAWVPGGNFNLPRERPGKDFLIVYDIGYGGGGALLHDRGATVLIDAGSRYAFGRTLEPSLRRMGLVPDGIVLSHADGGHIGGAVDALGIYPVRQILMPVRRAPRSALFKELTKVAGEKQIATVLGEKGVKYPVASGSWFEVLHAPDPDDGARADLRVMVLRLHWQGWRVLFLSDAGWDTERALLDSGQDLGADLMVIGRNEDESSPGDDFLAAVKPRAIIANHADFPYSERIPQRWAEHVGKLGIKLFHQGKTGAVTVALEKDGELVVRGFLDGEEMRLSR